MAQKNYEFIRYTDDEEEPIYRPLDPIDPTPTYVTGTYKVKVLDASTNTVIVGATVTFTYNGGNYAILKDQVTGTNGIATYSGSFTNDAPSSINFNVSMDGYEEYNGGTVANNSTSTIKLTKKVTYYYALYVRDYSSSAPISSATVKIYSSSTTISSNLITSLSTDSDGKIIYSRSESGTLYFKVTKNGYDNKTGTVSLTGNTDSSYWTSDANKTYVELAKITYADYYYNISVNDNLNNPVNDIVVRLYTDISFTTPYFIPYIQKNNDFKIADDYVFNILRGIFNDVFGIDNNTSIDIDDNISDFLNGSSILDGLEPIESAFNISFLRLEENIFENMETKTFRDLSIYVGSKAGYAKTYSSGQISIYAGNLKEKPGKIYAKGVDLDSSSGYTWNVQSGEVNSDTFYFDGINTVNSLNLSLNIFNQTKYYHNFVILDSLTKSYVSGASVVFKHNGETLVNKTTGTYGVVKVESIYKTLTVDISKNGYLSVENLESNGFEESRNSEYFWLSITPKYSIRVLDIEQNPVENITIKICNKNNGEFIERGRYTTNSNGYIQTLNESFFNGNFYAIIANYETDASHQNELKKSLNNLQHEYVFNLPPLYIIDEDGDNEYDIFSGYTINGIKKNIQSDDSRKVSYNSDDFKINIIEPDTISVYDVFTSMPVMMTNNSKSIIGSVDVQLKPNANDLRLKMINRYSGYYNPIFKDILFYNNLKYSTSDDENGEEKELKFSNTGFDYDYEDQYGKFGVIKNMWFHKVYDNTEKELYSTLTPYYPLTGQYALDYRDYNIFESNWDSNYYTRQTDLENSEGCENIASMKNGLCMFGSKYLNVPNEIEIASILAGDDCEWNDDWIANPNGCPGEVMFKEINNNSVDFYFFFKKRIIRYFYDKLKDEFEKYMGVGDNERKDFTFGNIGIEDDIEEYVTKNILKLYKLEKVRVFIRRTKRGIHNSKIENNYSKYLTGNLVDYSVNKYVRDEKTGEYIPLDPDYFLSHGFAEIKSITMTKMNRDDFDRKIVYNLVSGTEEEFGFSFVLKKI